MNWKEGMKKYANYDIRYIGCHFCIFGTTE
jgi:hypothetical protein